MSFLAAGWRVRPRWRPLALLHSLRRLSLGAAPSESLLVSNLSFQSNEKLLKKFLEENGVRVAEVKVFRTPQKEHRGCGIVMFPSADECAAGAKFLENRSFMGRKLVLYRNPQKKGRDARAVLFPLSPNVSWQDLRDELLLLGVVGMRRVEILPRRKADITQRAVAYFNSAEDCAYSTDLVCRYGVFGEPVTAIAQGRQIVVKRLPQETSKEDLIQAFECYGELMSVSMSAGAQTAFIRFRNLEAAQEASRDGNRLKLHGQKLVVEPDLYG